MKKIMIEILKLCKMNNHFLLYVLFALSVVSCKEEINSPIEKAGKVPDQVSDVHVTPTPGGADLVYSLPENPDLLYIEAVVNTPEGHKLDFISSVYKDTISIKGLATIKPQKVLLYSVTKSGMKSIPLAIDINPLVPPYQQVFQSLSIGNGLGGVDVKYLNESGADLAFFLGRVADGKFIDDKSYYSNKINGNILFWGYEARQQKFGVYIRDRWDHYSDTIYADVTPVLEILIDKSKFKAINLQNDSQYSTAWNEKPENLWDGKWSQDYSQPYTGNGVNWSHGIINGDNIHKVPGALTIDLGQMVNISRICFNHYWRYERDAPKKYEVYGLLNYSDDAVPYDMGAWYNWTLLSTVENVRPSLSGGKLEDDATNWVAGDNVQLTPPSEPVRYIRVKAVESWVGNLNFDLAEITVYGSPVK